ncbi:carbon-nitrogen hydrolase family protein [Mesorhizobium sp.]|uniref:carbon-nitrogen hydrolase family protein n=1 Tax=Mesorhizobium sp. TaxID=1871066 RepID=UPI000FEAAAF5|nr:carbon-nitrogen hydrolase family protein [Mesorhizobium sp.]RWA59930.1 MAG: carbon-nitrogen hydrolase family protein [Mesorhizobium sp.]RWF40120.1 MAG: carbon-nitrogen hydrolase family protein [Mesorhizobium sp.]TJW04044.1 MAG: carbon-nitrogen hydrolase family protein [Mesorhizobium sp.]
MTRIYISQKPPHLLDLDAGIATAKAEIEAAAAQGAILVVFPETWLGGYPAWVFGLAGWNDPEARHWFQKLVAASATVPGPHVQALCDAARDNGVCVVIGLNERARPSAALLYNSALTIDADGSIVSVHRKLTPTHTERLVWTPGDADGLRVNETAAGRVGAMVCWEHFHPIIRQALHAEDEQIHVALWPDMPSAHQLASRHYAFEGRCFVASAATYLPVEAVPPDLRAAYEKGTGGDASFPGGSGVIGPDGEYLVGPVFGDAPVICDLDLAQTIAFKHDLDVTGHYSRSDILHWGVDRPGTRYGEQGRPDYRSK